MPTTTTAAVQAARGATRTDLNAAVTQLATDRASLEVILATVAYDAGADAAAVVLQDAIAAGEQQIARLSRRLSLLGAAESTQVGGVCTVVA